MNQQGRLRLPVWILLLLLIMIGIIGLAVTVLSASPPSHTPPADPTNTPTSPPTDAPIIPSDTPPPPPLLPPPTLEDPENGDCLDYGSEVTLRWSHSHPLEDEEYYQLKVGAKEQDPISSYQEENSFSLPTPSPGEYRWTVVIVRSTGPDEYALSSEESAPYTFVINPPPIVHSISPTSTIQDTSVPVVIYGENFTSSHTLIISVPLQMTLGDSGTITATIPAGLEVGEYLVIVENSTGEGVSHASFIVEEPTPSSPPPPTSPLIYSAPILLEPEDGASYKPGSRFLARWEWDGQLEENEHFAVRLRPEPGRSLTWTENKEYYVDLSSADEGEYCWHVVVLRGTGPEDWVEISPRSEERCFIVRRSPSGPSETDNGCPPDCD